MDMDVDDDVSSGVLLEVLAASPKDRGSDVRNTCGGLEVLTNAVGNEGDDVIAEDAGQNLDAPGVFNTTAARPESSAVGPLNLVLPATADCCVHMSVWWLSENTAIARPESSAVR